MVVEDFQGGTLYLSLEGLTASIPHPSKDGDTGRIGLVSSVYRIPLSDAKSRSVLGEAATDNGEHWQMEISRCAGQILP
jgi:hypothetical protein